MLEKDDLLLPQLEINYYHHFEDGTRKVQIKVQFPGLTHGVHRKILPNLCLEAEQVRDLSEARDAVSIRAKVRT